MEIFDFKLDSKIFNNNNSVIALGKFLSFHRGHQEVFKLASKYAKEHNKKLIVMLYPDYKGLNPDGKSILPLSTRINLLQQYNVDYVMIFEPNQQNYQIPIAEFFTFLKNNLLVEDIFVGENFSFGKKNLDDFAILRENFNLFVVNLQLINGRIISSTLLHDLLFEKAMKDFKKVAGFNYFYEGKVVPGKLIGTKNKVPTANVKINDLILFPVEGIYASLIAFDNLKYYSVTSISTNPTFNEKKLSFETHILQFNNNLYGKVVTVELIEFIRPPIKFKSVKELYKEIANDILLTKKIFNL